MDIKITARAVFALPITRAHHDALLILSRTHYDSRCRMASHDNEFLGKWGNLLRNEEWFVKHVAENPAEFTDLEERVFTVDAFSHELDTTLKILESTSLAAQASLIDEAAAALCRDLCRSLWGAAMLANSKYDEWQVKYVPCVAKTA